MSHSARAARSSERCPSWSEPIVGTSPIDPDARGVELGPGVRDRPDDLHDAHLRLPSDTCHLAARGRRLRGRLGKDEVELLELGSLGADHREVPLDRLPVAARDGAGELEAALDDPADERVERLGRRAGGLEERRCRGAKRDEVVRGQGGAGVVGAAARVVERERAEAERLGEPEADRPRLVRLGGHRRPGAVELLGPARRGERLERVHPEAASCGSSAASGVAPLTCATQGPGAIARATSAIARSGTQRRTSSGRPVEAHAALGESRAHRRADAAAGADDFDAVDHAWLQFRRRGYRAAGV